MTDRRTALVTGSTSGIGRTIADTLARAGMNVVLNGFGDPAAIERQRASIEREHGVTARYEPADMARPAEIEAMMRRALDAFGAIDLERRTNTEIDLLHPGVTAGCVQRDGSKLFGDHL